MSRKSVLNRPDEDAINRILSQNTFNAVGVIIRLAWQLGLLREEMANLTWEQLDFAEKTVTVSERSMPISDELCAYLTELLAQRPAASENVVLSDRDKKPLAPQSISRLARAALDKEGQTEVRLLDLRHDLVIRMLHEYDWQYVSRIFGIEAVAMNLHFAEYLPEKKISTRIQQENKQQIDEFKLWKVLQENQDTPAGIVLWLTWQMGMQLEEIAGLTWEQVDFSKNELSLRDRSIPMTNAVSRLLKAQREKTEDAAGYVLLSPNARNRYDQARISKLVRALLIRYGMDNVTLRDLYLDYTIRIGGEGEIIAYVQEHGNITRNWVAELLHVSNTTASSRLRQMIRREKLTRVGTRYYLIGTVVPPEQQSQVILEYLDREQFAYRNDIADLLHVEVRQCYPILQKMVASGELEQRKQRYYKKA